MMPQFDARRRARSDAFERSRCRRAGLLGLITSDELVARPLGFLELARQLRDERLVTTSLRIAQLHSHGAHGEVRLSDLPLERVPDGRDHVELALIVVPR